MRSYCNFFLKVSSNSSSFKVKLCIFNETISIFMKIVLIFFDSPFPQCTDKTCFRMLYFNYELKIETGNENTKQNTPSTHKFG